MLVQLHQLTAAVYLTASLAAGLGVALRAPRLLRASVGLLMLGALVHGVSFTLLHQADPPPQLTDLSAAISFMAWVGTVFSLVLLGRARLAALMVLVAPMAFLGVFIAAVTLPSAESPPSLMGSGSWPHAHVLLASAGLSLFGVSGLAGALFLIEHRRIKRKRSISFKTPLPSLEALDRVNRAALAVGFPLLTLGVITGALWVQSVDGRLWSGTSHQTWTSIGWVVYAVLVLVRFGSHQASRPAAASAVGGFLFLLFAVVGVELLA